MPTDAYIPIAVIATVVAVAALVGLGTLIGYRRRTRAAGKPLSSSSPLSRADQPAAELRARDLNDCLHLADCLSRDADALSSMTARSSVPSPRELNAAVAQLLKTARGLEGRLRRVGNGELPPMGEPETKSDGTRMEPSSSPEPAPPVAPGVTAISTGPALPDAPTSGDFDDRKFPRSPCRGSFKATIYPPPSKPGGEPVQCTVLTRDISCGGIGIAHTEELYPKQIIVLHAVTKLLIGEVRWCRRMSERSYIAGCQLIKASG